MQIKMISIQFWRFGNAGEIWLNSNAIDGNGNWFGYKKFKLILMWCNFNLISIINSYNNIEIQFWRFGNAGEIWLNSNAVDWNGNWFVYDEKEKKIEFANWNEIQAKIVPFLTRLWIFKSVQWRPWELGREG